MYTMPDQGCDATDAIERFRGHSSNQLMSGNYPGNACFTQGRFKGVLLCSIVIS
jgi:hypothetical protein